MVPQTVLRRLAMSEMMLKTLIGLEICDDWVISSVKIRGEDATGSVNAGVFARVFAAELILIHA